MLLTEYLTNNYHLFDNGVISSDKLETIKEDLLNLDDFNEIDTLEISNDFNSTVSKYTSSKITGDLKIKEIGVTLPVEIVGDVQSEEEQTFYNNNFKHTPEYLESIKHKDRLRGVYVKWDTDNANIVSMGLSGENNLVKETIKKFNESSKG